METKRFNTLTTSDPQCADITLSADAAAFPDDQCFNSTGVGAVPIVNVDECPADLDGDSMDMDMDIDDDDDDDDADADAEEANSTESSEPPVSTGAGSKTVEAGGMLVLAVSSIYAAAAFLVI